MTKQEVLATHREVFYAALLTRDWDALSLLYAEDYTLVRSDGSTLGKAEVLSDLKSESLIFKAIELRNEQVRLGGPMAILTGESLAVSERDGVESHSHNRLTAVYIKSGTSIHLLHFQSTEILRA
jgi:ketosteroid isomerase-like protein